MHGPTPPFERWMVDAGCSISSITTASTTTTSPSTHHFISEPPLDRSRKQDGT